VPLDGRVHPSSRISCDHGQYGGAPSPSQHADHATRAPASAAAAATRAATQVLPIPASPQTRANPPRTGAQQGGELIEHGRARDARRWRHRCILPDAGTPVPMNRIS
jgi:hypothetical protein